MPLRHPTLILIVLFIVFALLSPVNPSKASSSGVVISQVYGGGGNSGSTYKQDFVEIFNGGQTIVNLEGWSLQYKSISGTDWFIAPLPNFMLQPGQYFLAQAPGATTNSGTVDLPTPDLISQLPGMSASGGRVALVSNNIAIDSVADPDVIDFVGYNTFENPVESEGNPARGMSTINSIKRFGSGCIDSNDNFADFAASPAYPHARNSQSPRSPCSPISATATPITHTPVPSTHTPTGETPVDTPSPLDTPVPPSPTPAEVSPTSPAATAAPSVELLVNGGMEGNPSPNNIPNGWRVKFQTKDRQKCNKDSKTVAYSGVCAFQFKGGGSEKSKLSQKVILQNFSFQEGDTLRLTFALLAPHERARGKIKFRIKYSDGTPTYKFDHDFGQTTQYSQTESFVPLMSASISKISLQFAHQSPTGKVYVDGVSLVQFKTGTP